MGRDAKLTVDILVEGAKAAQGLNATASRFESFAGKAAKVFAGAFAADKIVGGIRKVVDAASGLEQAVGGTDKVFGASAQKIHGWAADQNDAIRLSQRSWEQYATAIGASLRATGAPMSTVADQTHNLMQVSGDFASTFGRDIGEVANSVRAALAGEYDSLQNMGVAISGATVAAEALKIAQGDQAAAATDAVKAQAAYNVIMSQGALYSGQAAAEAGTFSGQVEDLKAQLDDAAGTIGGPLLSGFGSLIDRLSSGVPVLTGIATGLATVVSWVIQLPDPLFNAALAMAAFALAAKAGWITNLISGFQSAYLGALYARDAFTAAGGGLRGLGAAASSALAPLRGIGSTLAAGLGVGLIIGVVTAVVGYFQRISQYSEDAKADLQGVVDALVQSKGVWTDQAREAEKAAVLQSDAFKEIIEAGYSAGDAIRALTGDTATWQDFINTGFSQGADYGWMMNTAIMQTGEAFREQRGNVDQLARAQIEGAAAMDAQTGATENQTAATETLEEQTKRLTEALKDQQDQYSRLADRTQANTLLMDLAAANEQASRAAEIFNASLDKGLDRNRSYQQTTLDTTASIEGVASAFKEAAEAGQINKEALLNWDIGGLAEAGDKSRALAGDLLEATTQYGEFVTAAFEASGGQENFNVALGAAHVAADTFRTKFVDSMTAVMGGTEQARAEAEKLADSMGILDAAHIDDKKFDIIAEDEQALQKAKLWETIKFNDRTMKFEAAFPAGDEIAAELNAKYGLITPEPLKLPVEIGEPKPPPGLFGRYLVGGDLAVLPTVTVPTAVQPPTSVPSGAVGAAVTGTGATTAGQVNVPVATEGAEAAQTQIDGLSQGDHTVKVTVQASTEPAQMAITALVTQQRQLQIQVAANVAPAQGSINAVAGGAYSATVHLLGDSVPVNNTIRAVIGGQYQTTIHLMGDSVPVNNTIRAVIGGQYSTTVHIEGDNSGAISAIRSITTGYYSAVVHITADASGFWSVYNSLPNSKSITIQQNVVTVPSAAPAVASFAAAGMDAPMMASALAAPMAVASAGPRSTGSQATGSGTTIIVQGALDPDAVARQIRRIVVGRDRRAGGVVAGGVRRAI